MEAIYQINLMAKSIGNIIKCPWIEIAPPLVIPRLKVSNSPGLETIAEEECESCVDEDS